MRENNKYIISLCILLFLFPSCRNSLCERIKAKLEAVKCNDDGENCLIDMKDIFEKKWEIIYIFSGFNMSEDISTAIGFECNCKTIYDHERLILLILNGKIVERYKIDCNALNLEKIIKKGYVKIDSSMSEFQVSTIKNQGNKQYILAPQAPGIR